MKHSNWVLGLGILVAVLLIAGTLYLKADPVGQTNAVFSPQNSYPIEKVGNRITTRPIVEASEKFIKTLLY